MLKILIKDFQLKKYPKISCGAGILPANNTRTGKMPIPKNWIIFFVEFSYSIATQENQLTTIYFYAIQSNYRHQW